MNLERRSGRRWWFFGIGRTLLLTAMHAHFVSRRFNRVSSVSYIFLRMCRGNHLLRTMAPFFIISQALTPKITARNTEFRSHYQQSTHHMNQPSLGMG